MNEIEQGLRAGDRDRYLSTFFAPDAARAHLHQLVHHWLHAWHQPLAVPRKTACAWLLAQREGTDADAAARRRREQAQASRRKS